MNTPQDETLDQIEPFSGDFTPDTIPAPHALAEVETERAVAEVQAAMAIAKRFPRNPHVAFQRIMGSCSRLSLAEQSQYAYPRGTSTISGPTIRLAEVLAQNWGNLKYGMRELSRRPGESEMEAYCWDLETNVYVSRAFWVKHQREVGRGSNKTIKDLTDPRDVYEMAANQGQRRVRACILEIIPGDIVEAAITQCDKTLAGQTNKPIEDRIRDIITAFTEFGVTMEMIEARLGHKMEAIIEPELVTLKKIYRSLRDGAGKREDFFVVGNETAAPQGDVPPDEKPESEDEAFRNEWKNLRGPGLSTYVWTNKEALRKKLARWPHLFEEIKEKWARLHPDDEYPAEAAPPQDNPEPEFAEPSEEPEGWMPNDSLSTIFDRTGMDLKVGGDKIREYMAAQGFEGDEVENKLIELNIYHSPEAWEGFYEKMLTGEAL